MTDMKKSRIISVIVAIAATALLVFSCIDFNSIVWPSNIKADTEIEVNVQVQLVPETERDGYFLLAFVAPKSWKVSESISAVYSATDVQVNGSLINIDNEQMLLANDYVEPTTTMPYTSAMLSKYGVVGNTGPVEWICLRGTTKVNANGSGDHPTTIANVKITFKTGSKNIKFFSAFATCLADNGFNDGNSGEYICSDPQVITVTGGSGNDDYTVLHYVSTTPQTFRYGDFVSIEFVSTVSGSDTPLYGEKEVYMNSTITLKDGKVVSGPKTLMTMDSDDSYHKYIYPKSFFGVGENAEIVDMHVWFSDKSGSKVFTEGDSGFQVAQADE